jgi:hypothetical protein
MLRQVVEATLATPPAKVGTDGSAGGTFWPGRAGTTGPRLGGECTMTVRPHLARLDGAPCQRR